MTTYAARRGDMFSTLFYYANWHYISVDESYFTQFLGASPLRHAWSLAIEEQFYLVWPLLLLGTLTLSARATSHRRSMLLAIVLLATIASAVDMALRFEPSNPSPA